MFLSQDSHREEQPYLQLIETTQIIGTEFRQLEVDKQRLDRSMDLIKLQEVIIGRGHRIIIEDN